MLGKAAAGFWISAAFFVFKNRFKIREWGERRRCWLFWE
jgi:hypothetical protein